MERLDSSVVAEWAGWFILVTLGVVFLSVHFAIGYIDIVSNNNLYVGFVFTGLLSIAFVLVDAWLSQRDIQPNGVFRIASWCIVTTLFTMTVGITLVLYNQSGMSILPQMPVVVTNTGTAGAVVGVVAGEYDRQRISAGTHLQNEKMRTQNLNDQLTVMNRILRHDIRNDMSVIIGMAEMIKSGAVEPETGAEKILRRSNKVVELGNKANELTNLFQNDEAELEVLNLSNFVNEYIDGLGEISEDVSFAVDVPNEACVRVSPLIRSALSNVVDNAIEHNDKEHVVVEVSIDVGESFVDLAIADNGPGIPEAEVEALRRGNETPLNHVSGLGLWIIQWVVTDSGGWVEYEENEPTGSVIHLVFPREDVRE